MDSSNQNTGESDQQNNNVGFDQKTFEAVTGLVVKLSAELDSLKQRQKDFRESLKNLFDNDGQLAEYEEQAKKAAEAFGKRKKELVNSSEGKQLRDKQKEVAEEIRDIEDSLTNSLLSYYQMTGSQSFDTPAGQEREFRLRARLLPVKS